MPKKSKAQKSVQTKIISDYINDPNFGKISESEGASQTYTPEEAAALSQELNLEQQYGDSSGRAFVEGAVRGVVPAADLLQTKLGVDPEALKERKERNPVAAGTGEIAGFAGSLLVAPEVAAGKYSLGKAGMLGEEAIASAITKNIFKNQTEKKIAQKIIEKSIAKGAGGAVTGAAYGVNQLVNEDALGEAELNGENLLAYGGAGAVLNGAVGGAFGALEAATPLVKDVTDKVTGQAKRLFKKELDPRRAMSELAADSAAKRADVYDDLVRIADEDLHTYYKDKLKLGIADDAEALYTKNAAAKSEIGTSIGTGYKMVDQELPGGVVSASEAKLELLNTLDRQRELKPDLFDSQGGKNVLKQIENEINNRYTRVTGMESAEDFHKLMRTYGEKADNAFRNPTESPIKAQIYKELNRTARTVLDESIVRNSVGTAAENILPQIKKLNTQFRIASILDAGLEKRAAAKSSILDLKDSILAAGAIFDPAIAGTALLTKKFIESDLRRKFVVLNSIEKANLNYAKKATESIKSFLGGTAKATSAIGNAALKSNMARSGFALSADRKEPKDEKTAFKNIKSNLHEIAQNPEKTAMKIAGSMMKTNYAAPNTSKVAQMALSKAISFLDSKMPRAPGMAVNPITKREWEPNTADLAKFSRYVQIVDNPYSITEELNRGTITREHVEALQAVYPRIYQDIRERVMAEVASNEKDISYNKRIKLGILLNIPTDDSLNPASIAKLQSGFQSTPQQQQNMVRPTQAGASDVKIAERTATGMQKASEGINE